MARQMRKVRVGAVVRTRMDKTAVVEMIWRQRHTLYSKQMRRVARFYVHDPESQCKIGDTVRIEETRPISKTKHWRLLEILQHRQLAEVSPIELETEITTVMTGEALAEAPNNTEVDDDGADGDDEDEDTEK